MSGFKEKTFIYNSNRSGFLKLRWEKDFENVFLNPDKLIKKNADINLQINHHLIP